MNNEVAWDELIENLRRMRERFETVEVRLGVLGESGTGKSSLINRIFGAYVAEVGPKEQTSEPTPYQKDGVTFVDLPGAGTKRWPIESYAARLRLVEDYDAFLLVTRGRVMENDVHLYAQLRASGKPVFVLRNQFDSALTGERGRPPEKRRTLDELRHIITDDLRAQLANPTLKVYLTCAQPDQSTFDLETLVGDVYDALDDIKRVRFISEAAVLGKHTLEAKQEAASKIVTLYAGAAAANALNPVPGLDIAVDAGILIKMSRSILRCYGLLKEQIEHSTTGRANVVAMGRRLAAQFAQYLLRDGVLKVLARFATQETVKTIAKWVPFIGQIVAAGIGYKITTAFGNNLVEESHSAALELFDAAQRDVAAE